MQIISISKHFFSDNSFVCLLHITTKDNNYDLKITNKQRKLLVKNFKLVANAISYRLIVYNQKKKN